ncbi:hypothetical protein KQI77_08315 [Clostridium sp. MSJ-8]|uniref:hypothetical protein n=1 Tax=Clostridium sp. MSJ-8 TaxID=2841510 RepID=UPI001C0EE812|nr:hypothetical protein [Clostridium sp. MSJ-8]MBU5488156.1 hypothetical protein [Clostridium sp. MSJ-8]
MKGKKPKTKNKKNYDMTFDELAIPEIHTNHKKGNKKDTDNKPSVNYDTAIPEIHIKK